MTPTTLPELLVWPRARGEWVVMNALARTYAVADGEFLELLSRLAEPGGDVALDDLAPRAVEANASPFASGLLGDPTGLDRDASLDGAEPLTPDDAVALARRLMFAVDDVDEYAAHFGPRENVLDRRRRGNLHQRAGEYVMLELRERDIDEWWARQKFTDDRRGPRDGLYRDVQWEFMTSYYDEERMRGRTVLDFGCGPGLFARLFAANGASVVGLDTNAAHLETATRLAADDGLADSTEFLELELPVEKGLEAVGDRRFDLIFLSDVMMFYFHPYGGVTGLDPDALMRSLAALLAPGGNVAVLEPNGTFWHQPWLGAPERPFTILSEHRRRRYGVTPTLEQMSRVAEQAGLAISRVREVVPPGGEQSEERAVRFAAEFPIWWFFELRACS